MKPAGWIILAILTGLLCFTVALAWAAGYSFALNAFGLTDLRTAPGSFKAEVESLDLARIIFSYVLLPALIESVVFVLIYWLLGAGARFGLSNLPLFVILIGLYGYFAHGGTPVEVGKAAAFMVLGLLFWKSRTGVGVAGSFGLIALGHFVWNGTSILIWYFRQATG